MEIREMIVELVSLGYQSRNLIEPQVADYHAEELVRQFEASRICAMCGQSITDDVLEGTVWKR